MKVCPECKGSFPDDVEVCPDDGAELILGAEELPDNPELQEVIQVAPDDATSVVDLEALEREFRERQEKKAEQEAQRKKDEEERRQRELEEEEELARQNDPEATGTAFRVRPPSDPHETGEGGPVEESPSPSSDRPLKLEREKTKAEKRQEAAAARAGPAPKKKSKKGLVFVVAVLLLVVGGGGTAGWFLIGPGSGRLLTVQTVPKGASVFVDGKLLGTAPTQTRIRPGTHQIELTLAGYETFKEVFKVEPSGDDVRFVQPLKSLKPKPVVDETEKLKAEADRLAAKARKLIDAGKFDEALEAIKAFIKIAPEDPRGEALLDELTRAKIARAAAAKAKKKPVVLTAAQKRKLARTKNSEGQRQYRLGQFDEATESFREAIRLDTRYAAPHRSIARIYNRRKDIKKARYHLSRYLYLGGRDPDRSVKRWLDEHPK